METTQRDNHSEVIKFSGYYQDDLNQIWKDDIKTEDGNQQEKRDWSFYLKSPIPDWTGQLWKGLR